MNNRRKAILSRLALLVMALLVLIPDQLTKNWVVANVVPNSPTMLAPWIDPYLNVIYVTNTGTAFGLFQGASNVFTVIAIIVIVAILFYVRRLSGQELAMHLVLGVMLGGALGNLIDRFRFTHVVDFLHFNFWPLQGFPIWNIADFSIVTGVILLALLTLLEDHRLAQAQAQAAAAEAEPAGGPPVEPATPLPARAPLDKEP